MLQKPLAGGLGLLWRKDGIPVEHSALHLMGECIGPALRGIGIRLDERMGDGLGCDERIRHDATEEIVLSCDAKPGRLLNAHQRVARDEIDPTGVTSRGVVFACIVKAHQGSESLGDLGSGDPLMSIGEPACLRRVFDHHVVRQVKPPCENVRHPSEWNGSAVAETKPPSGQEFLPLQDPDHHAEATATSDQAM